MNQSVQSLYELFAKNLMQINIWFSDGRRGSPIWLKVNHQIKKKKLKNQKGTYNSSLSCKVVSPEKQKIMMLRL